MKQNQHMFKLLFGLAIIFFVFSLSLLYLTIKHYYFHQPKPSTEKVVPVKDDSFKEILKYTPALQTELKKYQLEKYTVVLAAIMHQESLGKGGDPMQSSESAGLPPNTIDDPKISIKQGVKHFHQAITYGNKKKVDLPTMIQAYNMGLGYISFISKNGGKHSEELAKEFSMIQVEKNPEAYNCGGDQENFRFPYCYGDFSYTTKVVKNMEKITESVIARSDKETSLEKN